MTTFTIRTLVFCDSLMPGIVKLHRSLVTSLNIVQKILFQSHFRISFRKSCSSHISEYFLENSVLNSFQKIVFSHISEYCLETLKMSDKVAVVLAGCGVFDGSEVHEASAVCVALSRAGKKVSYWSQCSFTVRKIFRLITCGFDIRKANRQRLKFQWF